MRDDDGRFGTSLLLFLAGAAVGAAVVALITPKTGPQLRGDLKALGGKMRDRIRKACGSGDAEDAQADEPIET